MRQVKVTIIGIAAVLLLAGCTTAPPTGTTARLYDAKDGKGVFIGQFGSARPTDAIVDLRIAGATIGATYCIDISVFDRPPVFGPWDAIGHFTACQLVPIATGDATVTLGPLSSTWDDAVDGPLEGRWFWAQVSVQIPPDTPLPLAGVRGITTAGVTATSACYVNPGVVVLC